MVYVYDFVIVCWDILFGRKFCWFILCWFVIGERIWFFEGIFFDIFV